jgi:putative transcriptional regulator
MEESTHLANHFLIAMPSLSDPHFARTVTFMCEHNEHGAMGLVINRPLEIKLDEVFTQMQIEGRISGVDEMPVFLGGPVQQERGFVLHRTWGTWESSFAITKDLAVTTSRDILTAVAKGEGPDEVLVALGHAGWAAGQLEQEMADNAWLSVDADSAIIFNLPPEHRWEAAAALAGVDVRLLSHDIGHA